MKNRLRCNILLLCIKSSHRYSEKRRQPPAWSTTIHVNQTVKENERSRNGGAEEWWSSEIRLLINSLFRHSNYLQASLSSFVHLKNNKTCFGSRSLTYHLHICQLRDIIMKSDYYEVCCRRQELNAPYSTMAGTFASLENGTVGLFFL